MSTPEYPDENEALQDGLRKAQALSALLEIEFKLLKENNLQAFEDLQDKKTETLEVLSAITPIIIGVLDSDEDSALKALGQEVRDEINQSRDAHLRNALLIEKKIEANRSALDVLRSSQSIDTGETYDKLGQLKRGLRKGHQADV